MCPQAAGAHAPDPAIPLLEIHARRILHGVLQEMGARLLVAIVSKGVPVAKLRDGKIRLVVPGGRGGEEAIGGKWPKGTDFRL